MKNTIFWLVKFFEKEGYANQFLKGKLFLNRLSYFKKIESLEDNGRPDKNEAVAAWLQPHRTYIDFPEHPYLNIRPENLAKPVSISFDYHNRFHIFCMTAIHTGEFEVIDGLIDLAEGDEEKLRQQMSIHDDCLKFGQFAVMVKAAEFVLRVNAAAEKAGYGFQSTLVEYYDASTFHGNFRLDEIPFRKARTFSYQKEYRFVMDTGIFDDNSKILEIGDINDIAAKMDARTINGAMRLQNSKV